MQRKLSPHLVWLFALVAVAGGLGVAYLTAHMGWKASAAALGLVVGALACAGGFFTRASPVQAIAPFVVGGAGVAAAYYVVIKQVMTASASLVGAGAGAANGFGGTAAILFSGIILVDVLVAGIGGAIVGMKLRAVKSPRQLLRPGAGLLVLLIAGTVAGCGKRAAQGEALAPACPSSYGLLASADPAGNVCSCPATAASGTVWGTGPYTQDSSLCGAALHAGVIGSSGGNVHVIPAAGCPAYTGSTAHGITTQRWGSYPASFTFAGGKTTCN